MSEKNELKPLEPLFAKDRAIPIAKMLPCPLCGEPDPFISDVTDTDRFVIGFAIRCGECQCTLRLADHSKPMAIETVIQRWNRRAAPEPRTIAGFTVKTDPTIPENEVRLEGNDGNVKARIVFSAAPEPGDRERAGALATMECPACAGRGEIYPLCPSCDDSTEDHVCPDPIKCKTCYEKGEIFNPTFAELLAAEFAAVRLAERERCAKVCEDMSAAFSPCAAAIRKGEPTMPDQIGTGGDTA